MSCDLEYLHEKLPDDAVIVMCGLPATGKSTIAKKLAKKKGYKLLSSDILRIELLKGEDIFDNKIASDISKRLMVYKTMFKEAFRYAKSGKGVILDATFITQRLRKKAASIAYGLKKSFIIIETICTREVALGRIKKRREGQRYESNAITEEAYINNLKMFEPVNIRQIAEKFAGLSIWYFSIKTDKKYSIIEERHECRAFKEEN